jgi:hypothetical protein
VAFTVEQVRASLESGKADRIVTMISRLVDDVPAQDLPAMLAQAAQNADPDVLGYYLLPNLPLHEGGFFASMTELAARAGVEEGFRRVLLDHLDATASGRRDRDDYWRVLRRIASDEVQATRLRMQAIRYLARDDSSETRDLIVTLLEGTDWSITDAAAHALLTQRRSEPTTWTRALSRLMDKALASPQDAFAAQSVIRALAEPGAPSASSALEALALQAETPEERANVLGGVGPRLPAGALKALIERSAEHPNVVADDALRGLLIGDPTLFQVLYERGHHREYLHALHLVSGRPPETETDRLLALCDSDDRDLARLSKGVAARLPEAAVRDSRLTVPGAGVMPLGEVLAKLRDRSAEMPHGQVTVRDGFSTGFHVGDALYRDLITRISHEHWHAGICLGFSPDSSAEGYLRGINAAGEWYVGTGVFDCIRHFGASRSFVDPSVDVASGMQELRDDPSRGFLVKFAEDHSGHPFHGARGVADLPASQRWAIAGTAMEFAGKDIWWTWVDMLDYKGRSWDGTLTDIDETRCDGLVEYSYERNGVRVCGGSDGNRWNIAHEGKEYVENHNDFHNAAYQRGELCPRIQAGDQGDEWHRGAADTALVQYDASIPAVVDFIVLDAFWSFAPSIRFRVLTETYETAFVRLTVSKDGGPFYFVRTEDPYNSRPPSSLVGDWRFLEVRANTDEQLLAWWTGATVEGPNYHGQAGTFEFRIVAIDNGGNVSPLLSTAALIRPRADISPAVSLLLDG